jgi:hypothetical protein
VRTIVRTATDGAVYVRALCTPGRLRVLARRIGAGVPWDDQGHALHCRIVGVHSSDVRQESWHGLDGEDYEVWADCGPWYYIRNGGHLYLGGGVGAWEYDVHWLPGPVPLDMQQVWLTTWYGGQKGLALPPGAISYRPLRAEITITADSGPYGSVAVPEGFEVQSAISPDVLAIGLWQAGSWL